MIADKLPLPDEQPVAVNALRNKRSALMGELARYQEEVDRIRSEIIHLDVVLRLFDPGTDPGQLPALRKRLTRTEWFARGEQTNIVYDALRERGTVAAIELAREAMKRKGIADHDRATYREFVAKFHNLMQHMGRRGQLEKIGEGQGCRWKLAPIEPGLI
jgi:hypothetical protein